MTTELPDTHPSAPAPVPLALKSNEGLGVTAPELEWLSERYRTLMSEEAGRPELCLWLSFCDGEKPKGQQFLGVVIIRAPGVAHAIQKAWALGINPGGQVLSYETDPAGIKVEHFDRLLSKADLVSAGYCDA